MRPPGRGADRAVCPGWRSPACQIAGPRPSPSLAEAEDESSWLVQFDRLGVRLPDRAY